MQRIGGTYDFFKNHMEKYKRHLDSRKNVLLSINEYITKNKLSKARLVITLKEYFKDYADICETFHQKSYKSSPPSIEDCKNPIINIRIELKEGFDGLFRLRKEIGN